MELSDEEVEQIQSVVVPGQEKKTYKNLGNDFPELSSKLFDAGLDFMWYTEYLDARLSGIWKENMQHYIDERKLMKEDIDSNNFDPHCEDGKLLRGQRRYDAWGKWEEEHLESLPFSERSSFYEHRYDIHDMEFDNSAFNILFPDEIIVPALDAWEEMKVPTTDYPITFCDEQEELVPSLRTAVIPVPLMEEEIQKVRRLMGSEQEERAY